MEKCPYCAEEIDGGAVKCKYCGEWVAKDHQQVISRTSSEDKTKELFEKIMNQQKTNILIGMFLEYLYLILDSLYQRNILHIDASDYKYMGAIILTALVLMLVYTNKLTQSLGRKTINRIILCILIIIPLVNAFIYVYLSERIKRKVEETKKREQEESLNAPSV